MKPKVRALSLILLFLVHPVWAEANDFNWRVIDSGYSVHFSNVAFVNGLFVTGPVGGPGGFDNTAILISPDGLTWTYRDAGLRYFTGATYESGLFVCSGLDTVSTTFDLVAWTPRFSISTEDGHFNGVASGNGLFLAFGSGAKTALSLDATNWIAFKSGSDSINGVAYGQGMFVTARTDLSTRTGSISSSTDGITWTRRISTSLEALNGIAHWNGQFVAVGDVILVSTNVVDWTTVRTAFGSGANANTEFGIQRLFGVAYGDGKFIAVGDSGYTYASTDGMRWNPQGRALNNNQPLRSVAFGNGKFVAVGDRGTILVSEPPPPPVVTRMGPLRVLPDGTVQSSVSRQTGASYLIQASTNLVDWMPLEILPTSTNATLQFIDRSATNFSRRFYRAVSP